MNRLPLHCLLLVSVLTAACTGMPPAPPLDLPMAPGSNDPTSGNRAAATPSARSLQWLRTDDERNQANKRITELLNASLTPERAVDIALLNNPNLQSRLAELGIGLADLEQASRLPNPGFSFQRTRTDEGLEIERGLHFNLVRILFYPQLRNLEARRFEQTRLLTLHEALSLANRTRRAFHEAVAARQKRVYAEQVHDTAEAASELARRLEQVGNYNPLSRAREQAFAIDAKQALTRARQQESASRVRLLRLLGLPAGDPRLLLPDQLSPLPDQLDSADRIRAQGISQRLDVQAARLDALRTADLVGLTKATRFVSVLELGALRESDPGGERKRAVEIGLQLPIFDSGDARVARAQASYERALARVQAAVVEADGDLQLALDQWQTQWELARRQRDDTVPLRKRITDESLLRYNGMIGSVFELLAESRAQVASVSAYIDLLRDFWQAQSDLDMALFGRPAIATGTLPHSAGLTPEAAAAASAGAGGHPAGH